MWTGTFSVWSSQTVWSAGVDKPHPPVPHTLCLCGAANQKKAGAMDINSLWAVTRNICLSLLPGFWSSSCCCNLFTSDPRAVWSVLSLILCWLRLLVFFSLSAPLCFVYLSSPSLVMYWSQPVFLTPCSCSLRDSERCIMQSSQRFDASHLLNTHCSTEGQTGN